MLVTLSQMGIVVLDPPVPASILALAGGAEKVEVAASAEEEDDADEEVPVVAQNVGDLRSRLTDRKSD